MSKIFEKYATPLGLVPMRVVNGFTPHAAGEIAGFPPATAEALYLAGDAVVVDEKGKEVEVKASGTAAKALSGVTTKDVPQPHGEDASVEIPENWESLHHLQQVKLAKAISGRDDIAKKEDALAVIRTEVERRAAEQSQT